MRREVLLLAEIVDAAERIVELTAGASVESIDQDRTSREALLWSFTVLGEACGQLPEAFTAAHPDVPWRALGTRLRPSPPTVPASMATPLTTSTPGTVGPANRAWS